MWLHADAVENIDIGGAFIYVSFSSKNHASVTVVVDPSDYAVVLEEGQPMAKRLMKLNV